MIMAIDTNRYRDFCDGLDQAVVRFQTAEQIIMPFPVLTELRAGFACGTLARKNERILNLFISRPRVECLFADEQTTFHFARLYAQLRQQGTPIPTHDLWIAALVQQHNLMLYTRDKHFDHLPQLPRLD
jgi:tRNA(fMet)-specific endonuclease VapC